MNRYKTNEYNVAYKGYEFNPNKVILPCPWDRNRVIVLYTNYGQSQGVIYYTDRKMTPEDVEVIQTVPGYYSEPSKSAIIAGNIGKAAIATGAGILLWKAIKAAAGWFIGGPFGAAAGAATP